MTIKLTKSAAERVRTFLDKDGGIGLRLGVSGVKIVISHENLGFLDGSEIDFVSEGLGKIFQFNNPNVTEECGCGESFTIG
jgi:iron-sulfur cluster assembly protein